MDLSPRLLTEVEFKEQWRGYSPTEVDQFLASVATAVGELQRRLHEAIDRAMRAEEKLLERTDDDEVRRTLVLAQRTAASAIEEARAEAEHLLEEARAQATEESAALSEQMRAEAEELTERRAALQADVDALDTYVAEQRARLRDELSRQLAALDATASGIAEPPSLAMPDSVGEPDAEPVRDPAAAELTTREELAVAREDLAEALRRAGVEPLAFGDDEVSIDARDVESDRPALYDADDESGEIVLPRDDDTQAFDALRGEQDDTGEHEVITWASPDDAVMDGPGFEDDPFLAELRRAVNDDAPLGPRDDDLPFAFSPEEDALPSGRFRRRRGR